MVKQSGRIVARLLDFGNVGEISLLIEDNMYEEIRLEKMLLETVYKSFLKAIILKLTEDFLAESQGLELESCGSPTLPSPLSGIGEMCLGAPVKEIGRKSLNIEPELCRKLEL